MLPPNGTSPPDERSGDARNASPGAPTPPADDDVSPFDVLRGHIDAVLAEWRTLVRDEPWASIPSHRLINSVPEMLPRLFKLADAGTPQLDEELSEFIAREHGYFRRDDGVPLSALADEWNHLKRACWKVLIEKAVPEPRGAAALQRLDALFDDAIGFSLRGYYSPELDALRGRGLERRTGDVERRGDGGDRRGER